MEDPDVKRWIPFALLLLLAACSSNPAPRLWEEPRMKVILGRKQAPLPYRLAVAPVELGFRVADLAKALKKKHVILEDREALRTEIVDILSKTKAFASVRKLVPAGGEAPLRDRAMARAWEKQDDLVLFCKLTEFETSYEGTNGYFLPNLLLWASFWWPSWWVADEQYGARVKVELTVVSAHSGKEVARRTLRSETVRDLDDFDRGWQPAGILRVPGSLDEENWEKISKLVAPYPLTEVKVEMAKYFHEAFRREAAKPGFASSMAKTLAVVVGLSKHESYTLHNIRFAARDARSIFDALVGEGPGRIPPKGALLLLDERATGAAVRTALEAFLLERARPSDRVLVYYAGYGAFAPGKKGNDAYLVPYDYDHKQGFAKSAISFAYLTDLLERCAAKNIVLMMDTSFGGGGQGRSCGELKPGPSPAFLDRLLARREGAAALFASGPGEKALEFEDKEMGLFSFYAAEGLAGKADKDKNGAITVQELADYTRENVHKRSLMKGESQKPLLLEKEGAGAVLRAGAEQ